MRLKGLGRALTPVERSTWEQRLAALQGEVISAVRYAELDYRDPKWSGPGEDPNRGPAWDGADFHSLDYGLELDFESGLRWWGSWQSPGGDGESLLFGEGSALTDELERVRIWDVSASERWQPLVGSFIAATGIVWDRWPANWMPGYPEIWCQLALTLTLDAGTELIITLGERDLRNGGLQPSADNLAIFWSREAAQRCGLLEP